MGRLGTSFGVLGWIKVNSYTDPPTNILNYSQWAINHKKQWVFFTIEASKVLDKNIIVKFQDCNNPEQARKYTNDLIAVDYKELPLLPAEEYYWADLIGLRVITVEGIDLGSVTEMLATGSNDVLVVTNDHRRLIPYMKNVIDSINLNDKLIVVNWDPNF